MFLPPEYDSKKILENGPEMWMNEIKYLKKLFIEQADRNGFINIIEWGTGNGTIYFSKFLEENGVKFKWYSIENFLPWHNKVMRMLKENNLSGKVSLNLKCLTEESDKMLQERADMTEYIEFPKILGIRFNIILIDGRKRKECLDFAASVLAPGGVVVLHDAERVQYQDGLIHYKDGGKFVTENLSPNSQGGIQRMWVGYIE